MMCIYYVFFIWTYIQEYIVVYISNMRYQMMCIYYVFFDMRYQMMCICLTLWHMTYICTCMTMRYARRVVSSCGSESHIVMHIHIYAYSRIDISHMNIYTRIYRHVYIRYEISYELYTHDSMTYDVYMYIHDYVYMTLWYAPRVASSCTY